MNKRNFTKEPSPITDNRETKKNYFCFCFSKKSENDAEDIRIKKKSKQDDGQTTNKMETEEFPLRVGRKEKVVREEMWEMEVEVEGVVNKVPMMSVKSNGSKGSPVSGVNGFSLPKPINDYPWLRKFI